MNQSSEQTVGLTAHSEPKSTSFPQEGSLDFPSNLNRGTVRNWKDSRLTCKSRLCPSNRDLSVPVKMDRETCRSGCPFANARISINRTSICETCRQRLGDNSGES